LRHPERAVQVDVDHLPELFGGLLDGGPSLAYAGVVHQAVDLPELGHREVDKCCALAWIGDVGRSRADGGAVSGELGRDVR
jgi:hypothetical protein